MKASYLEGLKGLYSVCCVVERVEVELQVLLQKCRVLIDCIVESIHALTPVSIGQFHRFLSAGYLGLNLAAFLSITSSLRTVILDVAFYL